MWLHRSLYFLPFHPNPPLQFIGISEKYGGGQYNIEAAAELRYARIQDSMARNPTFDFTVPRTATAYAESVFPFRFMVDGRSNNGSLDLTVARSFFQEGRFPNDFYRRSGAFGTAGVSNDSDVLFAAHPVLPGSNNGVGNYTISAEDVSGQVNMSSSILRPPSFLISLNCLA